MTAFEPNREAGILQNFASRICKKKKKIKTEVFDFFFYIYVCLKIGDGLKQ